MKKLFRREKRPDHFLAVNSMYKMWKNLATISCDCSDLQNPLSKKSILGELMHCGIYTIFKYLVATNEKIIMYA